MRTNNSSLSVGMKLKIEISKENDLNFYPSQLLDIINKEELIISGPIIKSNLVFIPEGENINISYMIKDKGKHYFSADVISRTSTGIYKLKIKRTSDIKVIQDREHFRLSASVPISKYFEKDSEDNKGFIEDSETKDISGGGMKIYSNVLHEIGDTVACSINLFDEKLFIDIEDRSRDIIVKYIFEEQRKLRLKGLI